MIYGTYCSMDVSDIETKKIAKTPSEYISTQNSCNPICCKMPLHLSVPSNIRDTKWVGINSDRALVFLFGCFFTLAKYFFNSYL